MACKPSSFWNFRFKAVAFLLGAAFPLLSIAQTNFAVLTSDGAWTWYNDPRAVFHNGILYFGYVRNADGKSDLSVLDPQTCANTELFTSTRPQKYDLNYTH